MHNLEREDGIFTETGFDKAEYLSLSSKTSIDTLEDDSEPPKVEQRRVLHRSHEVTFTEDDIEGLLSKLNIANICRPGWTASTYLKGAISAARATTLHSIPHMSLETGMLPDDWKIAQISPIVKKGHRYKPGNVRPVSLP